MGGHGDFGEELSARLVDLFPCITIKLSKHLKASSYLVPSLALFTTGGNAWRRQQKLSESSGSPQGDFSSRMELCPWIPSIRALAFLTSNLVPEAGKLVPVGAHPGCLLTEEDGCGVWR